jgi:serine/threonine protein kinase
MSDPLGAARDPGSLPPEDPFERLVIDGIARVEVGGQRALETICQEHPEFASRLRRRIGHLIQMGLLEPGSDAGSARPVAPPQLPERLGDFALLRPIGHGGMGVVYLAFEEKLGREVALKLIRPDQLYFPGARERFRREVEAIARLAHPGIVTIHTVGEETGIPYFAMERIRGASLGDVVQRLEGRSPSRLRGRDIRAAVVAAAGSDTGPSDPDDDDRGPRSEDLYSGTYEQVCLRIGRQVAEALEHAHRHAILHRDVKPNNVMLTPEGRVLLLDFGLATTAGVDGLTRPGTQLGSLFYMSPEQARGQLAEITPRSDVYSLGVTLYEALTLGPPYVGDSAPDVMRRIQEGNPQPPRARNAALSWEAETVILKAMDPDPARRYASAAAFARDLGNVLAHEAIEARRAGPILRLRRFVRRRPALAVALLLSFLAFTVGPAVLLHQERNARRRIEEKNELAERNFEKALAAVDAMLTEVAEVDLRHVPQMEGVRRKLIEQALGFYAGFLEERSDDPALRRQAARVHQSSGELEELLGDFDAAEQSFRTALAMHESGVLGSAPDAIVEATVCRRSLCAILRSRGRIDDAFAEIERAIAGIRSHATRQGAGTRSRSEYAECVLARATLLLGRDPARGEQDLKVAIALLEALRDEEAQVKVHRLRLARARNTLGVTLENVGRAAESVPEYRAAIAELEELLAAHAKDPEIRYELASITMNLGALIFAPGNDGEAMLERAAQLHGELVRDFPAIPDYRRDLHKTYYNLGYHLGDSAGRDADARKAFDEAIRLARELVAEHPQDVENLSDLALALDGYCNFSRARGELDSAAAYGEESLARRREIVKLDPSADMHRMLGAALNNLALVEKSRRRLTRARELLEEAVEAQDAALAQLPEHATSRRFLRFHLASLADTHFQLGDFAAAERGIAALIERSFEKALARRSAAGLLARMAASETAGSDQRAAWRALAIDRFREALELGLDAPAVEFVRTDSDYAPLRALPEVAALLAAGP